MSRKLIMAIVALSFVFTGAAFAAVENIKVSGDIGEQYLVRDFSMGAIDKANDKQGVFSQIRLRFDADLTEGVSATVRLLNERLWGVEDGFNDTESFNLDLGYIELKEFLYQPLTMIIGRQNLRYGNALIIGDPDTNQTAAGETPSLVGDLSWKKSFDAARAVLDFSPYTIDVIYASLDENDTGYRDEQNIYGVYGTYDWSSYNGVTEAYFIGADNSDGGTHTDKKERTYTVGARAQMDPNDHITLGLEGAWQFGNDNVTSTDNRSRRAYATQLLGEYRFLNKYNAKVGLDFTYLSGDKGKTTGRTESWDPLYEDQTPGELINILFSNTNLLLPGFKASIMPREDLTLNLRYVHARYARKVTGSSYSPSVGPATSNTYVVDANKKYLGDEVDFGATYDYTEDVQFNLSGALFMPGAYFTSTHDNTSYSVRGGVTVNF